MSEESKYSTGMIVQVRMNNMDYLYEVLDVIEGGKFLKLMPKTPGHNLGAFTTRPLPGMKIVQMPD